MLFTILQEEEFGHDGEVDEDEDDEDEDEDEDEGGLLHVLWSLSVKDQGKCPLIQNLKSLRRK